MTRRTKIVALAALAVCASTVRVAQAQFIKDLDLRTIVDVGRIDVAPCTCVAKPFTFPEFRVDARWGHGPASPMWPGPRPETERAALAYEAADLAAHIDETVLRALAGNPTDALRIAFVDDGRRVPQYGGIAGGNAGGGSPRPRPDRSGLNI